MEGRGRVNAIAGYIKLCTVLQKRSQRKQQKALHEIL